MPGSRLAPPGDEPSPPTESVSRSAFPRSRAGSLRGRLLRPSPPRPRTATRELVATWAPVVVWAGVIFAFSSVPSLSSGLGAWDLVLRKAAHLSEYAILGALLLRALDRALPAFLAAVAYAVSDEIHQHFVAGRSASPVDVLVDAVGIALGVFLFRLARSRFGQWAR